MVAVDPTVQSQSINHAQTGEGWLRKYLANLGKEEKDMARELWDKNWTAIAEVRLFFSLPSSHHLNRVLAVRRQFRRTRPRLPT